MVAVAQLVESRIVIPVVVGSSPISHPTYSGDGASGAKKHCLFPRVQFPTVKRRSHRACQFTKSNFIHVPPVFADEAGQECSPLYFPVFKASRKRVECAVDGLLQMFAPEHGE